MRRWSQAPGIRWNRIRGETFETACIPGNCRMVSCAVRAPRHAEPPWTNGRRFGPMKRDNPLREVAGNEELGICSTQT